MLGEMAEKIFEIVRIRRHVSFVELERMVPGFKGGNPERCLCFLDHPNIVLWVNLSDEAIDALEELRKGKKIFLNPCSFLVYFVDGGMLNLPIPKRMPRKDTKKDYWVPCTLDVEPSGGKKAKRVVKSRKTAKSLV